MKTLAVLSLALTMSTAFAAQEFGGISFHSSVPQEQVDALKVDISYLYQNPVTKSDPEFLAMSGLPVADGANMHNWLVNRVKHIIGEGFELNEENIAVWLFHSFPKTPLPDAFKEVSGKEEVTTIMSNIGTALYLVGKKEDLLFGLKLDGDKVYAKSSRVGILQVGKGLFLERFRLNKDLNAPANSVSRLGTLFHEARHSDGNSAHTGFTHDICPSGHAYEGHAACETSSNGSYSLGAVAERNLLQNCASCSVPELAALSAGVADGFSRVVDFNLSSKRAVLESEIKTYGELIKTYEGMMIGSTVPEVREIFEAEIKKLKTKLELLSVELEALKDVKPVNLPLDPTPEGKYSELALKKSIKLMNRSLEK